MKLYEYEAKQLLSSYGIPVPEFGLAKTPEEAREIASRLGGKVVLKAQVLVAGRGKAGGIKFAESPQEAYEVAKGLLGMEIKGEKVNSLLVSKAVDIQRELYLSIVVDRSVGAASILASPEGGIDIEELAAKYPEKIVKVYVDPLVGLKAHHVRRVVGSMALSEEQKKALHDITLNLYRMFVELDCELAEINPLAVDRDGNLVPVDAKVIIDDNALFRRKEFAERASAELSEFEAEAKKHGFSYVELDGDIGIIGNGAGLTMATMDVVKLYGGRPANFLDIGGGARADIVEKAASLLLMHPKVKVLFVNVLGGITRCDEVAKGLVNALTTYGKGKRLVVRLMGTNEDEGKRILNGAGISAFDSMEDAAKMAVELARVM
ncbi:MAG: succinate--CoA ligase subunit beta [Candidatus Terraquivivens tikiterensis]|uniref:Succinate--CoA ligase [ADP-forming] subunit beta n=1 Tax=Candidatus Terraquivivens tikiterensis TaxID=1980982 RepID=A0A2R7YA00_9ARCH|nr:MAG: succinate--CoA ligase subunit beta [Candidatus Terraquivivens tikiterensis]